MERFAYQISSVLVKFYALTTLNRICPCPYLLRTNLFGQLSKNFDEVITYGKDKFL